MQITKRLRKAKGFTLVELLIVIIIIGILAGMMMIAAGSATDKAEATKIVSNMRNIKAAAIMHYADTNVWTTAGASLDKYLDVPIFNGTAAQKDARYTISGTGDQVIFTGTTAPAISAGVKTKLTDIANATGGPITASGDVFSLSIKQ